jgi:glycerophosphoryl diester phosphodiesterase
MKDLSWLRENLIAHRGLHSQDLRVPENSLLAFKEALERGYSIELDINATKDGVVLAFHDFNLKRLCGVDLNLSDVTYEEIKHLKIHQTDEKITLLKEVLNLVDGKVPLLIEFKPHGDIQILCESFMKTIRDYTGKYAIFSFHPKVVGWFKKHHPEIIRGQIAEYFKENKGMGWFSRYLLKSMFFNRWTKPDFISYGIKDLPNKYVDRFYKKGMTVISYAAKTEQELNFVKSHYHNVVFEYFEPKK